MTDLSRVLAIIATPLLFGYIWYHPPVPSAGPDAARIVPGLVFGVFILAIGLFVEDDGGDAR
ncbi:hypothetical protein [Halorhabdus salina]|uniref:hypothetical protein n=1 Tax=Halorhabdus salina TaxID=2750670 RepID=UPI0015EE549D|nr:hypothetical protein [Halorhabdus salina]